MICGYNNIYDLCLNKYTYQYVNSSGSVNDPVLRIDKTDNSRSYISPINTDVIVPCDYNDEIEAITSWDCYQIYKNFSLSVSSSSLEQQKTNQKSTISSFNNSTLNAGIDIPINNDIITLKTTKEDQIHIGNTVAYANLLYEQNSNNRMPPILDINSNAYNLNYQQLFTVCSEYLNTVILYHYINKDLDNNLSNSTTSDEIASCNYCDSKQPKSFDVSTIPLNDLVDNDTNLGIPRILCSPGNCTSFWMFANFDGGYSWRVITGSNCSAGCVCEFPDAGPHPEGPVEAPYYGQVFTSPCYYS